MASRPLDASAIRDLAQRQLEVDFQGVLNIKGDVWLD